MGGRGKKKTGKEIIIKIKIKIDLFPCSYSFLLKSEREGVSE